MCGLFSLRRYDIGVAGENADLLQGGCQAHRVASELYSRGVGQVFALARDGRLNQLSKEDTDPSDENQAESYHGKSNFGFSIVTTAPDGATMEENAADHGEEDQTKDEGDQADIELHIAV